MRRLCYTWQTPPAQRNILETLNSETKFAKQARAKTFRQLRHLQLKQAMCTIKRLHPISRAAASLFFEIPYLRGRNPLDSGPPLLATWAARHYARPGDGFPSHGSSGSIAPLTFVFDHRHHRRQSRPRAARHCPTALLTSWRQNHAHHRKDRRLGWSQAIVIVEGIKAPQMANGRHIAASLL